MNCINDYVIPAPGSLVCEACGSKDSPTYTVVYAKEDLYPNNWSQYELTLMARGRLVNLSEEKIYFHHNWHVLHRPGFT